MKRLHHCLVLAIVLALSSCDAPIKVKPKEAQGTSNAEEKAPAGATAVEPAGAKKTNTPPPASPDGAAKAGGAEIVFDPMNPPAGYTNCHHNHCHLAAGGVESYEQVMKKMGATKVLRPPEPKAPADAATPPANAVKTASGLTYVKLADGTSDDKPGPQSTVVAHISSWQSNGKFISSTSQRGKPATVPMQRIFPGLMEALQLMTPGSEYRFWMPASMAYNGRLGDVVFDVQLVSFR